MPFPNAGDRKLTELDFTRLKKLRAAAAMPQLDDLLDDAEVVAPQAIPADVVTMYAQVIMTDLALQQRRILVVCYPRDIDPAKGCISALSPAGAALLGLPVGAVARWDGPRGEACAVRIDEILYQPEASGDYLT